MSRSNILMLLSLAIVFGLGMGAWVGLRNAGQPAPYVARGAPDEPPEETADPAEVGPEGRDPATPRGPAWMLRAGPTDKGGEKGPTLRAPDQPGWTTRVGPTHYGLTLAELVAAARSTARLGEVEGEGDLRRVEPFVLAALPVIEGGEDDMALLEEVVRLLRVQKIVSFANPVGLAFPTDPGRLETWEDEREGWIGVPVPPGTPLAEPLKAVPFAGANVVVAAPLIAEGGAGEDWRTLIAAARDAGREPTFPLLYRFAGWIPALRGIQTQLVLPLKGAMAPSP